MFQGIKKPQRCSEQHASGASTDEPERINTAENKEELCYSRHTNHWPRATSMPPHRAKERDSNIFSSSGGSASSVVDLGCCDHSPVSISCTCSPSHQSTACLFASLVMLVSHLYSCPPPPLFFSSCVLLSSPTGEFLPTHPYILYTYILFSSRLFLNQIYSKKKQ